MKKIMARTLPIPAILMLACFALGTAHAESPKDSDGKGDKPRDHWLQELNLSPEQKEQLKTIKDKYHNEMKEQKKAMKEARSSLQASLKSDASDKTLRKQFNDLQKKRAEFAKLRFEKILAIRAILTPEQRAKFEGMRKHRRHHHEH